MYSYLPNYIKREIPKNHWILQEAKKKWLRTIELREDLILENYQKSLLEFFILNEGNHFKAYEDSRGFATIGIGFLLGTENSNIRKFAIKIFKDLFDKDISNLPVEKIKINESESIKLFEYSLKIRRINIKKRLKFFDQLNLNEQLSIESIFYNCERLLGRILIKCITDYFHTKEQIFLIKAVENIEQYSNPKHFPDHYGIQRRRDREGAMMSNKTIDQIIRK